MLPQICQAGLSLMNYSQTGVLAGVGVDNSVHKVKVKI